MQKGDAYASPFCQRVEKVFSPRCLSFRNFEKVSKTTDFNGEGHPSWVSLTHPFLPLSQIYHLRVVHRYPAGAQLTDDPFIEGGYYNTGTVTVKDCTFNAITTANIEGIDLSMEKNAALTFEGSNVFDGRVATDADKPEGAADMKIYSTQSIKAYRAKTVNGKENVMLQGMVK